VNRRCDLSPHRPSSDDEGMLYTPVVPMHGSTGLEAGSAAHCGSACSHDRGW